MHLTAFRLNSTPGGTRVSLLHTDAHMDITLPLDKMTTAEKLRAMEALWADLSRHEEEVESPPWHEQVLEEREQQVQSGQATFLDWETAKKELRDRLK